MSFKAILAAGVFAFSASSAWAIGEVKYPEVSKATVSDMPILKRHGISVEKVYDTGGFYLVEGDQKIQREGRSVKTTLYVTKNLENVIFGYVLNAKTGKAIEPYFDKSAFKKSAALTIGTGMDDYYLFTDPSCPFCKQFEKMVEESPELLKRVRIHVYFLPLVGIPGHEESPAKSMYVMSRSTNKERAEAMSRIILKDSKEYTGYSPVPELRESLAKMEEFAKTLDVKGTPTLLGADLRKIGDWKSHFAKRYDIDFPISAKALDYLKKNVTPAELGEGKKSVYVFADAGSDYARKFFESETGRELLKTRRVLVWPVANAKRSESAIGAAYILSAKSAKDRSGRAKEIFLDGKTLSETEKAELKSSIEAGSDVPKNFGTIAFVLQREGVTGPMALFDETGRPMDVGEKR